MLVLYLLLATDFTIMLGLYAEMLKYAEIADEFAEEEKQKSKMRSIHEKGSWDWAVAISHPG